MTPNPTNVAVCFATFALSKVTIFRWRLTLRSFSHRKGKRLDYRMYTIFLYRRFQHIFRFQLLARLAEDRLFERLMILLRPSANFLLFVDY